MELFMYITSCQSNIIKNVKVMLIKQKDRRLISCALYYAIQTAIPILLDLI
jgi:hypothetical protein